MSTPSATQTEYLKHLRLTHFTLVVTCVLLIGSSFLRAAYRVQAAYSSVRQIENLSKPILRWAQVTRELELDEQMKDVLLGSNFFVVDSTGPTALRLDPFGFFPEVPRPRNTPDEIEHQHRFPSKEILPFRRLDTSFEAEEHGNPFETYGQFIAFWDSLEAWQEVYILSELDFQSAVFELNAPPDLKFLTMKLVHSVKPTHEYAGGLVDSYEITRLNTGVGESEVVLNLSLPYPLPESRELNDGGYDPEHPTTEQYEFRLRIPATIAMSELSLRETLAKHLRVDWPDDRFARAFPELHTVAAGLETLELGQLKVYLSRLREETGESLEILGAKLPGEFLSTWGVAILIGMQMYFYLHLRALRSIAGLGDIRLSFPWIGVYSDVASQLVLPATIVSLPVMTSIYLARADFLQHEKWSLMRPSSWLMIVSLAIGVATLFGLIRYRRVLLGAQNEDEPAPSDTDWASRTKERIASWYSALRKRARSCLVFHLTGKRPPKELEGREVEVEEHNEG